MPKDNETVQLPLDGPVLPSEPQGFSHEQMIRCEECLRANPPTRVNCLYCGAALPLTKESAKLRRPTLRQPEKHEAGFNSIFVGLEDTNDLVNAASLLKLPVEKLEGIIATKQPLPLARTASVDEAQLVFDRLHDVGIKVMTLSDEELGLRAESIVRVRSLNFEAECLLVNQGSGKEPVEVAWATLCLIVPGRLVVKKVEFKERMSRNAENEILDMSQFFSDELVFDLYSSAHEETWRIGANSFDFSCLGSEKTLVSGENVKRLMDVVISRSSELRLDNSYADMRPHLDYVWPMDQETHSQGWRRQRPGKFSIGAATVNSNERQFSRYSRLRRYVSTTSR
ncbi:MAG TPA: hypothetical protein VI306_10870 [Pyrinomonadaceae bacterium]